MIHRWKLTFFATWKLRKMLPRLRQAFFVFSMFWMSYTATQIDGGEKFSCTSSVCVRRWARIQCGKLLFREIYVFLHWNIWFSTPPPPESTSLFLVCIWCICVFRSDSHSDVKNQKCDWTEANSHVAFWTRWNPHQRRALDNPDLCRCASPPRRRYSVSFSENTKTKQYFNSADGRHLTFLHSDSLEFSGKIKLRMQI